MPRRQSSGEPRNTRRPPAKSPDEVERRLVSMAVEEAEKQLREGRASAQLITALIKTGSEREKYERKRLELDNELLRVKIEAQESSKRMEELYKDAINAMRIYSGQDVDEEDDDY